MTYKTKTALKEPPIIAVANDCPMVILGETAKQSREENPQLALKSNHNAQKFSGSPSLATLAGDDGQNRQHTFRDDQGSLGQK